MVLVFSLTWTCDGPSDTSLDSCNGTIRHHHSLQWRRKLTIAVSADRTTREHKLNHVTYFIRENNVEFGSRWMADLALEGLDYLEPLEADVRVLRYHRREPETPPLNDPPLHHLADYDMDESLLSTTVPEPIRIRGVGGTTM